jgi:integrase/recombinase XerD
MLEFCFMEGAMQEGTKSAYDSDGRRKYLTKAEAVKFLRASSRLATARRLLCETIHFTGCRISEALSLTSADIDPGESVLSIRCLKKRGKIVTRRVPVPPKLAKDLRSLAPKAADGRLWPFSRTTGWRIIKGVMNAAGIEGIQATTKGLRHGFGVRGALGKVPVNVIQRWMGHSDPNTTAIYLAVRDDEERELIKRTW